MLRARVMFLALSACGGAPPAPAAPLAPPRPAPAAPPPAPVALDRDLPRLAARSLAMYRDVAAAFDAAAVDCPTATAKLDQLAGAYREVVLANAQVLHDGRAAELRAALAPLDADFTAAAAAVMHAPTLSACASDTAFAHALDGLFSPP